MRGGWFRKSGRRHLLIDIGALIATTGAASATLWAIHHLFRGLLTGVVARAPSRRSRRKGSVRLEHDAVDYSVQIVGWSLYGFLLACATLGLGGLYLWERSVRPRARAERLEIARAPLDTAIFKELGQIAPRHWNALRLYVRWQGPSLLYYQLLSPEGHADEVAIPEAVYARVAELQKLFNREWMTFASLSYDLTRTDNGTWQQELEQNDIRDLRGD